MNVCEANALPQDKYPSELPSPPEYKLTKLRPLSLMLTVYLEGAKSPSTEIQLLLPQNARLEDGLRFVDGCVEVSLSEENPQTAKSVLVADSSPLMRSPESAISG